MKHKHKKRAPDYTRVVVENCINAYVDGGNNVNAIWDYLKPLINKGEITEPYAKIKAREALDVIKPAERIYKDFMKGIN